MTQYTLADGYWTADSGAHPLSGQVGTKYHVGFSDGTHFYGYTLAPDDPKSPFQAGWRERSDLHAKDLLTQYSSPNVTDRDFVNYPRVTDGDFSGGGLQLVFNDATKYFDSDLDVHYPGQLQLAGSWTRVTTATTLSGPQITYAGGTAWAVTKNDRNLYAIASGAVTPIATSFGAGACTHVDFDAKNVYVSNGAQGVEVYDGSSFTDVITGTVGGASIGQIWIVNQGTNGRWLFYYAAKNLYKVDLTAGYPVASGSHVQIPLESTAQTVIDLVKYQTGIAILTTDNNTTGAGSDLWYFDGSNTTSIVRLDGFIATGMCNWMGNLFVSLYPAGSYYGPQLIRVTDGTVTSVIDLSGPTPVTNNGSFALQPRAGARYVYWPVIQPQLDGISSAGGYIVTYNPVTGAVGRLPQKDANDWTTNLWPTTSNTLRAIAPIGDTIVQILSGSVQSMPQGSVLSGGAAYTYQPSGWLVGSIIDFTTPSIYKQIRRVNVTHLPLNAGEQVLVQAWVEKDPNNFSTTATQGSGPSQYTAQATNSTTDSTLTTLTLPAGTIGEHMFFALQLTAGTDQATSPSVQKVSIEIATPYAWEMVLDCTRIQRTITQDDDPQGVRGKDLAYLLRNAWENSALLTMFHRNGTQYTVDIESIELWNPSPHILTPSDDEEYLVHLLLRQSS